MLASCLLPTYNKFANDRFKDCTHLIEESLESYRRQDYEHKELIICNDCPQHTFDFQFCKRDNVTIINLPKRFRSLGEKLNFMAGIASGDFLFRWDDDDLYLPWRISTQMKVLQQGYDYVTATAAWWWNDHSMYYKFGSGFSQIAVRRSLMVATRGYAFMGVGEDQEFESRVRNSDLKFYSIPVDETTAFAIYRWGTGSEHVSGYGAGGYEAMGKTNVRPASKSLKPHWREDYAGRIQGINNARKP